MIRSKDDSMGRFSVEVELSNNKDLVRGEAGDIPIGDVRRTTVRGVVESGASRLVIPESVARQLGLPIIGQSRVRYADGRDARRDLAGAVHLSWGGRAGVFSAIVEPGRSSALIGAIVLEELDLLIDCANQRLQPRDPNLIVSEAE
jgi:predicted aspartyl protease